LQCIIISRIHRFLFFVNMQNIHSSHALSLMRDCLRCRCDGFSLSSPFSQATWKCWVEYSIGLIGNHLICRGPLALPKKHRAEVDLTCFPKKDKIHTFHTNILLTGVKKWTNLAFNVYCKWQNDVSIKNNIDWIKCYCWLSKNEKIDITYSVKRRQDIIFHHTWRWARQIALHILDGSCCVDDDRNSNPHAQHCHMTNE
jgi:hypothetical protein